MIIVSYHLLFNHEDHWAYNIQSTRNNDTYRVLDDFPQVKSPIYLFQHLNIFLIISITNFTNWFKFKKYCGGFEEEENKIKTIKSKTRKAIRSFGNRMCVEEFCDSPFYGFKCEIL